MIRHKITLYITKKGDQREPPLSPFQIKKLVLDQLSLSQYGTAQVTEVETRKDNKEIDYKCWPLE